MCHRAQKSQSTLKDVARKVMDSKRQKGKNFILAGILLGGVYGIMDAVAKKRTEPEGIDDGNPYIQDDKRDSRQETFYEGKVKPVLDTVFSFFGLVVLSPLFGLISLVVYLDDPGPIFFTQKRVGKDKHFFMLHKYRSMKMSTPHDVPTHMLENPEQYITRIGRFLRKSSMDELPQIWDIFRGKMSIIGPRPALWNQADLVEERDRYSANSVTPGLTGFAQINGRDELEISDKAKLDGEYTAGLHEGGFTAFKQDMVCFVSTISSILRCDGIVEGGTGAVDKADVSSKKPQMVQRTVMEDVDPEDVGFEDYGCKKKFHIDKSVHKKVLITGIGSYIGESFAKWAEQNYPNIEITVLDMVDEKWRNTDFSGFDAIFHVAGIAHADVGKVNNTEIEKYYRVNRDLAVETAQKAKLAEVKQFVFMSTMIVYGESAPYGKQKKIDEESMVSPANFYGDSKWQADKEIRKLADGEFKVAVLRPPMIYGRGCKGNYPKLVQLAKKLPCFPDIENERSMLYIDNLCEFLCLLILSGEGGIYFPQNVEYARTSEMVRIIAETYHKSICITKQLVPAVIAAEKIPGKTGRLIDKAFGNFTYDQRLSEYEGMEYQKISLAESIEKIEEPDKISAASDAVNTSQNKKNVLIVASVASMIDQFNIPNIKLLISMGYGVDVATNFKKGSTCSDEKIQQLLVLLEELQVDCYQIDFARKVTDIKAVMRAFKQLDDVVIGKAVPVNTILHHRIDGQNRYALVHSHSPIGGAIGRIVAKRRHIKNIYTAHGFHFYDGAPKKNWLFFYPVELGLSWITDVLITINREDYRRAKKNFHAKKTVYIPGVGIDARRFMDCRIDEHQKREELNIPEKAFVLLSVGELQDRKNHRVVIEALHAINNPDIYYLCVGQGELKNKYEMLVKKYGLKDHVMLLGYKTDIEELCRIADCFVHPSKREGLGLAPLEAMASGLPLISADINGIKDYTKEGYSGCCVNPESIEEMSRAIIKMYSDEMFRVECGANNMETAKRYDINISNKKMSYIYSGK